jgi:hypothetical protein
MDADAALERMRTLVGVINRAPSADVDAELLASLFEELDEWLRFGGFLPRAWTKATRQP